MICPKCQKAIDLPFEVDVCPHCDFNLSAPEEQLGDSVLSTTNPLSEVEGSYTVLPKDTVFLNKYKIKEHIGNYYPFSYHVVSYNEKKYILQIINISPLDTKEIDKKIKKEFKNIEENENSFNISIIEHGFKNGNAYFLLEYFTLETVEEVLNTTSSLSEEYILNLILFLLNWYEKTSKPHVFLSPSNIVNLGNNQFKVFNHKIDKIFASFIKPFYFFKENVSKYLAPELFKGNRLITKKADLYSIGQIWDTLLNLDFLFKSDEDDKFKNEIKDIIKVITLQDYEERIIDKEILRLLIEDHLSAKSNSNFITQKINLDELRVFDETQKVEDLEEIEEIEELEEVKEEIKEEFKEKKVEIELDEFSLDDSKGEDKDSIKEPEVKLIESKKEEKEEKKEEPNQELGEEIEEIEEIEIEPEIIIKKISPPSIPIAPPSLKIKKITQKEFKIAKKQLNKNPIDLENLKTLYLYYSDKGMIDEAFIVSNLLNFMNDGSNSDLLFKYGKNVDWKLNESILTDDNLEKILPKKIYFNTSGVMQALNKTLNKDLPIIKTYPPVQNSSSKVEEEDKLEIINEILGLSGLKDLKVTTTTQVIDKEKNRKSVIFKKDKSLNLMIKKDFFDSVETPQLKVILSKLVFLAHPNIVGNFIYSPQTIKDIFYGAMKFVIPSSRNMYNSKISNILFKELESQKTKNKLKRTDVIRLVMLMNEHLYNRKSKPNIEESMRLIEIASDRFALIVSNDLNTTLKTFLNHENMNIILTATERMKSLLKYVLSEEYFQLRKDIKQSVKA